MPILNEFQLLDQPALIDLYELDLSTLGISTVYRFVPEINTGGISVRYKGQTYDSVPIQIEGFESSLQAPFPRPTMTVSNIFGTISSLIVLYQDLAGAKITRRRTLVKYLEGGTEAGGDEITPEIFFIERKIAENDLYCAFELVSGLEMSNLRVPNRPITRRCVWIYRGPDCGYTGTAYFNQYDVPVATAMEDKCGKRLSSCKCRFGVNAELPFGGFPAADLPGAY